jgi:hypothetical protein
MPSSRFHVVSQATFTAIVLGAISLPVEAASPPIVEITSDTVTINGIAVTPTLAKGLFLKALGEPTEVRAGVPGTARGDVYRYDSLGLQLRTNAGAETVTDMFLWIEKSASSPREIFQGSILVLGHKLPLDEVQHIRQAMPELGLERKSQYLPFFDAVVGKWKLNVGVNNKTGTVTTIGLTFQSTFCSQEKQTNCFDPAANRWRAP